MLPSRSIAIVRPRVCGSLVRRLDPVVCAMIQQELSYLSCPDPCSRCIWFYVPNSVAWRSSAYTLGV